jgi:hypothetical protein
MGSEGWERRSYLRKMLESLLAEWFARKLVGLCAAVDCWPRLLDGTALEGGLSKLRHGFLSASH